MGWDLHTLASTTVDDLEGKIGSISVRTVGIASLVVIGLLIYAALLKRPKNKVKKTIFGSIAAVVMAVTILLFGTTIYINSVSDSGGPVHWHADVEFWACGTEIELRDPKGALSNKIGTATYHEHNDKRIHLEGVVVHTEYDASLEKFMAVTGGSISGTGIVIPTEPHLVESDIDGDAASTDTSMINAYVRQVDSGTVLDLKNGDTCGSEFAEVQAFVMKYDEATKSYTQEKLAEPKKYVMRDHSIVPPGDCLIVEYAPTKSRTDKLCEQYGVRDINRCAEFTGGKSDPKICNIFEKRSNETEATGGTPE